MVILINHRFTATVAVALKPFIHFGRVKAFLTRFLLLASFKSNVSFKLVSL